MGQLMTRLSSILMRVLTRITGIIDPVPAILLTLRGVHVQVVKIGVK